MTILGTELAVRKKAFFSRINSNNVVLKYNKEDPRASESIVAHLRGLGNDFESMINVKNTNKASNIPPFKYIKTDWRKKRQKWLQAYEENKQVTDPNQKKDISSRFVLKSSDPNFDKLNKRNQLGTDPISGEDEIKYLYDTRKNCPSCKVDYLTGAHNSLDAKFSEITKTFNEEMRKLAVIKGVGFDPLVISDASYNDGEAVKFYFEGSNYDYRTLDAVSKICIYDEEINKGGDQRNRVCSDKLSNASKRLQKYEVYGICKFFLFV